VSHFITNGLAEGRTASFDGLKYIASYADLIQAFGTNAEAGVSHFITNGLAEGRTSSFNAQDYLAKYVDLRAAFGTDAHAAELHFITNGFSEGRSADLSGNDSLTGSAQAETLNGGAGNDVIYGAGGADTLFGGIGADQFIFKTAAESTPLATVTIADFNSLEGDVINLSAVDANANAVGTQHFTFIGNTAFTGHAGELRFDAGTHQLMADTNGDGQAHMQISLVGVTDISVASLLLV
jgi:Ca2+-binding RTX toxin-like protein